MPPPPRDPVLDEDLSSVSHDDMVACVRRELGFRKRVYAERVERGTMTAAKAETETLRMKAVLKHLLTHETEGTLL